MIRETTTIPELKFYCVIHNIFKNKFVRATVTKRRKKVQFFWMVFTQLIKTGIAEQIETDFYLTLDSRNHLGITSLTFSFN